MVRRCSKKVFMRNWKEFSKELEKVDFAEKGVIFVSADKIQIFQPKKKKFQKELRKWF